MNKIIAVVLLILIMPAVFAGKVDYKVKTNCKTNSMSPNIECGDTLILNTYTGEDLIIDDVYCYRPDYRSFKKSGYYYACHRLKEIIDGKMLFKGDNNIMYDPLVKQRYIAFHVKEVIQT